jgi:cadmium resistance protein CadD (predicted permease)
MPNRSIVVIQLRASDNLTEFVEVYNGKSFNSMEVSTYIFVVVAGLIGIVARDMPYCQSALSEHQRG